ncbi:MAG: OmpA family protein [Saprospiraceae bacterium]|nr:OmpA family protein [Saprospiraceae bacterium]
MKLDKFLLVFSLLSSVFVAQAQPLRGARPEFSLKTAEEAKAKNDYYNALEQYEKYYEQTKDRAVASEIAFLHLNLRDYTKAETWFARVLQRDKKTTGEVNPETRFFYAQVLKMNEKYEEAIINFEDFLKESKDEKKQILAKSEIEGAKMAQTMKENLSINVENAGSKVNSPNNEYSPSVSSDGSTLFFTAFRNDKIALDGKNDYAQILATSRSPRGNWIDPAPISGDLNYPNTNYGSVYVSPDGKTMLFTKIEFDGNEVVKSALFSATKNGETWGSAKEIKGINGSYVVKHPCMGELYGKEVLFFASNMEGTKGGFDIYYANRDNAGEFGTPINAGDVLNTIGDEETPFYRGGKLFFSSTGHPGIGGFDIFSANWNGTAFTKPENLGKGINTSVNDRYYNVDDDGSIYLLSNRPGGRSLKSKTCCEDIYVLKKDPIKVNLIVTTSDGKKPLGGLNYAFSEVIENKSGAPDIQTADTYRSDLGLKRSYRIITSKKGYVSDTTEFNTVGLTTNTTIEKKIVLKPLPTIAVDLIAKVLTDGKPLAGAMVQLTEMASSKKSTKTGDVFNSDLEIGKSYRIIAGKQGFVNDTVFFNTNDIKETTTIEKLLNLKQRIIVVKRNERIKLENIYYKLDKSAANEAEMENWALAQQSLDYLYGIMAKYPDMVIELSSHTDSRGGDKYNLELSQKRAEGAEKYLMGKGIEARRIVAKGYGETKLVNKCVNGAKCSEDDHLKNRRTEFRILSGPDTIEITEQQSATNN